MNIRFALLLIASLLWTAIGRSEPTNNSPRWLDNAALTAQNVVITLEDGSFVRVDMLGERLFRIRHARTAQWTESALNRYDGMPATRDFTATIHLASRPQSIRLDGVSVTNAVWDAASGTLTAAIPACGAKPRVLVCE